MDLTEDTPVRLVRSPSTHDLDLTAEEEKIKIMRTKSFGSCKITISTSNLSVIDDVDYLRFIAVPVQCSVLYFIFCSVTQINNEAQ